MLHYLIHRSTGNVVTPKSKKIIHYSYSDFITSIVKGKCCFICGVSADSKEFNDEHVIPNWILRHFGTPESFMILPNGRTIKNSQYKVPCCRECNSDLGEIIEHFASNFLRRPYKEIRRELEKNNRLYFRLLQWMYLLFFKTHYKDCFLRVEMDNRKSATVIAETFCWHQLYQIHAIVRRHYTHAQISDNVYGSLIILEALQETPQPDFDYLDNLNSQVMMVKVGNIVIFSVLNDCGICENIYQEFISKITGSLSSVQIREIFARLRYANQQIEKRPEFYTVIDRKKGHRIKARIPKPIRINDGDTTKNELFKFMRFYIGDIMPKHIPDREKLLMDLEQGHAQYVFDENNKFYQF